MSDNIMKRPTIISILILFSAGNVQAATGDILAVRIASSAANNGWVAEIDINGIGTGGLYNLGLGVNNNPSTAKIRFGVDSLGYDATGAATTIRRTIYGAKQLRKPYPNQTDMNETTDVNNNTTVRIAMSDFIYASDTNITVSIDANFYSKNDVNNSALINPLSVVNNSTLAYPKCIGHWAWPGYERITSSNYTAFPVEAVVFDRFAMNGKPVACVVFTATDQKNVTISKTVTNMTISTRTGDVNPVLVYAANMDMTSLADNNVITFNFKAYPWVGGSGAILDLNTTADGTVQPDPNLGPLYAVNDKNGNYGVSFCVVDPVNGQDANTAVVRVYATQALAEAAYDSNNTYSYLNVGRAGVALKTYNNTHYGRNEPGAGTALLVEGNHALPGYNGLDCGAQNTWCIITPRSGAAKANVIFNTGTNKVAGPRLLKYDGVTLANTSDFRGDETIGSMLWIANCNVNMTGTLSFYRWSLCYGTDNSVTAAGGGFRGGSSKPAPFGVLRGNTVSSSTVGHTIEGGAYCTLGNKNIVCNFSETGNSLGQSTSDGGIVAFNSCYNLNNQGKRFWVAPLSTVIVKGVAVVQNMLERTVAGGGAEMEIAGDSMLVDVNNAICWHNTIVGEHANFGYNDIGTTPYYRPNWSIIGNLFDNYNNKNDLHGTPDMNRIGALVVGYAVGGYGNFERTTASSPYNWGEFAGLSTVQNGGTLGFVANDANSYGTPGGGGSGTGNGDYHLTSSSSALNLIPSGKAVLPFDIDGVPRRNDGTGAAGAYEFERMNLLAIFASNWLQTCSSPSWCEGMDNNHSDRVDFVDFATLAQNW
jgi:hypothetical protein